MTDADLKQANLTKATFRSATLTGTNLASALITGANFEAVHGFTKEQLYSTSNYKAKHLADVGFAENDLAGWNFQGQNLANAAFIGATLSDTNLRDSLLHNVDFSGATLAGADLTNAIVTLADFRNTTSRGFTQQQLYSTASYRVKDMRGISFWDNDLTGWNFVGQDLSGASFSFKANLTRANLSQANLGSSDLSGATLTGANLTDANLARADLERATDRGFTQQQLYSTASYKRKDLHGISLRESNLNGWDLSEQNLSNASFDSTVLANADLSEAVIAGVSFRDTTSRGLTSDQLYSTASYQEKNLSGVDLGHNDLSGWNFAGQNLANGSLIDARLTDADFTGADLRGVTGFNPPEQTRNMIWPNGEIRGLDIGADETLVIRDGDRDVTVRNGFAVADGGLIELVVADTDWHSTVTWSGPNIQPELAGTLRISFDPSVAATELLGTTFDLFQWHGSLESSTRFARIDLPAATDWDLSGLYETGKVTLTLIGDFNNDQGLGLDDMNLLTEEVIANTNNRVFDLNGDASVDQEDRRIWLETLVETSFGDANLDQRVGFADFVLLANGFGKSGGWEHGDFDGDGVVQFDDFVTLANNYQPASKVAAVPEPSGLALTLLGMFILSAKFLGCRQ